MWQTTSTSIVEVLQLNRSREEGTIDDFGAAAVLSDI